MRNDSTDYSVRGEIGDQSVRDLRFTDHRFSDSTLHSIPNIFGIFGQKRALIEGLEAKANIWLCSVVTVRPVESSLALSYESAQS